MGRTHGRFGLEEMVRMKYLDSDLLPRINKAWWYGYGAKLTGTAEGFLDFQFAKQLSQRLRGAVKSVGLITRKRR